MATHFDDPHWAQKVLGHKNLRTTEIYLHELGVDRKAADVFESIYPSGCVCCTDRIHKVEAWQALGIFGFINE